MKNLFNYIKITFDLFLRCLLLFFFPIFQNLQIFLINETQQLFSISTNFSNFIENYIRNYNRWNGMEIWYFFFFYSSRAMRNEKIQRMLMMAYEWCHGSCISLRREKEREREKRKRKKEEGRKKCHYRNRTIFTPIILPQNEVRSRWMRRSTGRNNRVQSTHFH